MATQLKESFTVSDPDQAWDVISDVNTLIPCVPGAKVISADSPTKGKAEIDVQMGSMGMKFSGPVEIVEADAGSRRAVIKPTRRKPAGRAMPTAP